MGSNPIRSILANRLIPLRPVGHAETGEPSPRRGLSMRLPFKGVHTQSE